MAILEPFVSISVEIFVNIGITGIYYKYFV
jgi:hypothetical protein